MKKNYWFYAIILLLLFVHNDIDAKEVKNSNVKIEYNNDTKELIAYGYNKFGNLGTGKTSDVSEIDKVNINNKIGKQKIVDYVFAQAQTFVLTESGNVFASGLNIGDGDDREIRTTFRQLIMYNNKLKITSLNLLATKNNNINLEMLTNNKNQKYLLTHFSLITQPLKGTGTWNGDYYKNEYFTSSKYLIYKDVINKNSFLDVTFNSQGKKINSQYVDKSKKVIIKNIYNNGIISQSKYMSEKKTKVKKYNKGLIKSQTINYFKKTKKNYMYHRYTYKKIDYLYNKNKIYKRVDKKYINKKMKISLVKYYYRNSKGELKSNKNGTAKIFITHYKNGKAKITYKYKYNKNGKMINKTEVRLKLK